MGVFGEIIVGTLGTLAGGFLGLAVPARRQFEQIGNRNLPNQIPIPAELVELRWRKLISNDIYEIEMSKHGFDAKQSDLLFNGAQQILNAGEIVLSRRRGIIDDKEFNDLMRRNRFTQDMADKLDKVLEFRPAVQDLIRFAVREIFTPEIRNLFELDAEFPEIVAERGKELGLRESDTKDFWAAHWELPSIQLGREMFHRLAPEFESETPVTQDDFDTLLRAQDVMRFWRPRIRKVLFSLPTRVDVRRMLGAGIITRDEALSFYKKLGYSVENAESLTKLAESIGQQTDKNLSRTLIMKAFKFGEIDRDVTLNLLTRLGFSNNDAQLIIKLDEIQESEKIFEDQIDVLVDGFIKGVIDETTFTSGLDGLNLNAIRRSLVVADAVIKKTKKTVIPPKGDIKAFFITKIIEKPEAELLLSQNGVRAIDVPRYIQLWETNPAAE